MTAEKEIEIVKESLSNFEDIDDFLIGSVEINDVLYTVKKSLDFDIADKNDVISRFVDVRGEYFDIYITS